MSCLDKISSKLLPVKLCFKILALLTRKLYFRGSIYWITLRLELLSLMKLLYIYRDLPVENEAGIPHYFLLHISNLANTDVKFGVPKIFTESCWKSFDLYSATSFSKSHINRSFNVVKDPCVFRSSSLHLSAQFWLFFNYVQENFLPTSILILVLCSYKYTTSLSFASTPLATVWI